MKTEVVSETIEKLKNNKNLNKWLKEGLDLYNQSNKGDCYFCEQPMPENRIEALKKHFSQDYQNLLSNIKSLKRDWESKKIEMSMPNKNSLYDDLSSSFREKEEKLKAEVKKYNQFINKTLEQLKKKKENPFESSGKIHHESFKIKDLIDKVNKIISQHNEKTDNFKEIRLNEKKDIEKHFLFESYEEYQNLKSEMSDLEKSIEKLMDEKSEIEREIEQLSQKRYEGLNKITDKKNS